MTEYKILGQSAPSADTETTLYTVPSTKSTVFRSINVTNSASVADTFDIFLVSASAATPPPTPLTLWLPFYASLNSVVNVSPPTTNTFQASFEDFNNFNWELASYWTAFSTAIGTVGNMTQIRVDQGGGTVHDYDVVTDLFSYTSGAFNFTWRAYWYVGGTWNGTSGTLPAGTSGDPHPSSSMGGYTVSWLTPSTHADSDYLFKSHEILGNETITIKGGYTMDSQDSLLVKSINGTSTFHAFGGEI